MISGRIFHTYVEKKRPPAASGGPPGAPAGGRNTPSARVTGVTTRLEVSVALRATDADALINALVHTQPFSNRSPVWGTNELTLIRSDLTPQRE